MSKFSLSLAVLVRVGVLVTDQSLYSLIVVALLLLIGDGKIYIYADARLLEARSRPRCRKNVPRVHVFLKILFEFSSLNTRAIVWD